jgi:dipeptidyl aminopeptidase/acylaminoacyl peptidase
MSRVARHQLALAAGITLVVTMTLPRAAVLSQSLAAGGRALAIEDYYRIQTIAGPRISPDGRWVVYTVSTRIEEDNGTRAEVHVVPADGSATPRRVVHYGKDVSDAQWTRDSRLEYSADRQRWTVDPAGDAIPPALVTRGPADAVVSADGQWIAFTQEQPQPSQVASHATDFERRHEERFKGVTFDWKDFQRDGAPFPAPNPRARPAAALIIQPIGGGSSTPPRTGPSTALRTGEPRVLVDKDLRPENLAWHPNGRMLAFTADDRWRDEMRYEQSDLWTVTTDGTIARLTDDLYQYGDVEFSPDGRYLSYVRTFGTDMVIQQKLNHGGQRDLFIKPIDGGPSTSLRTGPSTSLRTGEPINLTAAWDLEPGDTRWSPDGRFMYFTADTGGESHLFRVSVPGATVEQVTRGPRRLGGLTIDRQFTRIAYTVGVHDGPPEVYSAAIDGTHEVQLTHVHDAIRAQIAFSRAERLRWPSIDGTEIEGWLMYPHGYNARQGPYPLIVVSHGGPHSATGYSFDFKKQYFAANGYFVLDTNFRSSTGYGDVFKWATWGEWGKKDGEDVISGVDYVLERYPIDATRVGHTGHSYGGFMTNWLITQYPTRFAAAITGAGISNWISDYGTADIYRTKETEFFGVPWEEAARNRMIKQSPLTYAGNVKTPTLFVHGEVDQRVPYEEGEQMYFALKRRGVPAKMIRYADQPHGIGGHWNNVHRMLNELKWWNTYLRAAPTKPPTPTSARFALVSTQAPAGPSSQQPKGQSPDRGRPTQHDDQLPLFDFDSYFLGKWTFEWDMPEGPLGPAGRIEGTTVYTALGDGAYAALTEADGPSGKVAIKELIRYQKDQKVLTRAVTDSRGYSYKQDGSIGGDLGGFYNIYFESEPFTVGGKSVRVRHSLRLSSPLNYRVATTVSIDGGPFTNYGTPWWRKEL